MTHTHTHTNAPFIATTPFHYSFASSDSILLQHLQYSLEYLYPPCVLGDSDIAAKPQTFHLTKAAWKQQWSGDGNSATTSIYFSIAEIDRPVHDNRKLMNSILGCYNEHSVHNFKSLPSGGMAAADAHAIYEVGLNTAAATLIISQQQCYEEVPAGPWRSCVH